MSEILESNNLSYSIRTIKNYPNDGNHLEIVCPIIPYTIRLGEDTYYYRTINGSEKCLKPNTWAVTSYNINFPVQIKEFKTIDLAISYSIKEYKRTLKQKIKNYKEILQTL